MGLSLLICLATVVLWVRGNWYAGHLYVGCGDHCWIAYFGSGEGFIACENGGRHPETPILFSSGKAPEIGWAGWSGIASIPNIRLSDDDCRVLGTWFKAENIVWGSFMRNSVT